MLKQEGQKLIDLLTELKVEVVKDNKRGIPQKFIDMFENGPLKEDFEKLNTESGYYQGYLNNKKPLEEFLKYLSEEDKLAAETHEFVKDGPLCWA